MNNSYILNNITKAFRNIKNSKIILDTPLRLNQRLSNKYKSNIYLKYENEQLVRSFKIRGAYNKIITRYENNLINNVVTASAGNHAQGVALTCNELKIKHNIFLPINTPKQKIDRIKYFGGKYLNLNIVGNNFDEALKESIDFTKKHNSLFVHPFDDYDVILGQSTIACEINDKIKPDYILSGVGGGGLISGICVYNKLLNMNNDCKIIGVEPKNANSLQLSMEKGKLVTLDNIDTFVDGASVKRIGEKNFEICNKYVDNIYNIDNNKLCYDIIDCYQNDGIILEPAGCLSISVLDQIKDEIIGKNVVCILSGGNNDITRYSEMIEKSLIHQDLKHYFLVDFVQKPGELKKFINNILSEGDDITRFEYLKKTNKEYGTVLIGIQLGISENINNIVENMSNYNFQFSKITENDKLYNYII